MLLCCTEGQGSAVSCSFCQAAAPRAMGMGETVMCSVFLQSVYRKGWNHDTTATDIIILVKLVSCLAPSMCIVCQMCLVSKRIESEEECAAFCCCRCLYVSLNYRAAPMLSPERRCHATK